MYIYMQNKIIFEWDPIKNVENIYKHGVSFWEAKKAFLDPERVIIEDISHSDQEERLYCLGIVEAEVLMVRFTLRNDTVRIYGAGYWRKGRKLYEKKNSIYRQS